MSDSATEETVKRYWLWERLDWPDRSGHFIDDPQVVKDHGDEPDMRFTEYVPAVLLDEALEAMEQIEDELTNGATANWHYIKQQFDTARSIRADLGEEGTT